MGWCEMQKDFRNRKSFLGGRNRIRENKGLKGLMPDPSLIGIMDHHREASYFALSKVMRGSTMT